MQHSILLSEETQVQRPIEVTRKRKKKEFAYPKFINESTLLSVSIISFCTLLVLLGSPLWFAISLAVFFLGLQLWIHLRSEINFNIELDAKDVQKAIELDLFTEE
ncbi:hypothetical protein [Croceivirga thetidis]|uniref:2TM domain-containing protein n=1 Tax=Croceivirga thetidis TaxID=2721623 RepID=A0ABX1GP14_9FLAO|nr:hypothetical protein [Croceivirga thetidis]NKI31413.1 hypothetical protein [Croceivirga thetidis]